MTAHRFTLITASATAVLAGCTSHVASDPAPPGTGVSTPREADVAIRLPKPGHGHLVWPRPQAWPRLAIGWPTSSIDGVAIADRVRAVARQVGLSAQRCNWPNG
jgi:hypothetical protein